MCNEENKMRLEEYKELRTEIRLYLSERNNIKRFAYIIVLALLSVLFGTEKIDSLEQFWLVSIASMFILILWYQENRRIKAIFRTSSYIQVRIEPKMSGLNWETDASKLHPRGSTINPFERLFSSLDFPLMFAVLIVYGGSLLFVSNFSCIYMCLFYLLILLFLFFCFNTYQLLNNGRKEMIKKWSELE